MIRLIKSAFLVFCSIFAILILGGCQSGSNVKMTVENQQSESMAHGASASPSSAGGAVSDAGDVEPLDVGDSIPAVRLASSEGAAVDLLDVVKSQPTVIVFYRGGWCPYCNTHLSELQTAEQELQNLGFRVVAISPDRPAKLRDTEGKLDVSYMLLSDSKAEAVRAFGLAFTVDPETVTRYLGFGINLEDAAGEAHHQLPVPAVFIADTDGVIQYRYYNPDYKVRLSKDELLAKARELK